MAEQPTREFSFHFSADLGIPRLLLVATLALSSGCASYHVSPGTYSSEKAIMVVDSYMKRTAGGFNDIPAGADSATFSYAAPAGGSSTYRPGQAGSYTVTAYGRGEGRRYSDISDVKVCASPIVGILTGLLILDPTAWSGLEVSFTDGTTHTFGENPLWLGNGGSAGNFIPFYLFTPLWKQSHQAAKALLQLRDQQRGGTIQRNISIQEAAKIGDVGAVTSMLHANPKMVFSKDDQWGATALHWASWATSPKAIGELLLANGADAQAKDNAGQTPLHWAAAYGNYEMTQLLLVNRPELDTKSNNGMTPLDCAVKRGNDGVAQLLRKYGGQ